MVITGAEGPKWGRSPVLNIGRREFITLLGDAATLVTHATIPVALRISGQQHRLGDPRFRTIQVYPKDLWALPVHP
jgi:hypothetical protein